MALISFLTCFSSSCTATAPLIEKKSFHMLMCLFVFEADFFLFVPIRNMSFGHELQRFIVPLHANFCSASKLRSNLARFPLIWSFWQVWLGSLQHQMTSHAMTLTILWPKYLAEVSASWLHLPSSLSAADGSETSRVLRSPSVQTLQFVFHRFTVTSVFSSFQRQFFSQEHQNTQVVSAPFHIEAFVSLDTKQCFIKKNLIKQFPEV